MITKSCSAQSVEKLSLNDFSITGLLAEGSYAEVFEVLDLRSQKVRALKRIHKKRIIDMGKKQEIYIERVLLQYYTQSNGIPIQGMIGFHGAFQDDDFLYFTLDLCPYGDFSSLIATAHLQDQLPEMLIKYYLVQIIHILIYLHGKGIAHLDLKPSNLVIDENCDLKIIDFSTCYFFDKSQRPTELFTPLSSKYKQKIDDSPEYLKPKFVGTAQYISPEMLEQSKASREADLWSLGVLIYEAYHNKYPFDAESEIMIFDNIVKRRFTMKQDLPLHVSSLIDSLLCLDPQQRIGHDGTEKILEHPYFHDVKNYKPWEDRIPVGSYMNLYRRRLAKQQSFGLDSPFKTYHEVNSNKEVSPLALDGKQKKSSRTSVLQLKPIYCEEDTTLATQKEEQTEQKSEIASITRIIHVRKFVLVYEHLHCLPTIAFCELISNPKQLRIRQINKRRQIIFQTNPHLRYEIILMNQRKYLLQSEEDSQVFYDCEITPFPWIKLMQNINLFQ